MLIRPVIRNLVRSVMRPAMQRGRSCSSPINLFVAGEQGVWYDPSDFSTMFQDSAGTVPVTALNDPVGKILDKSGRGNHATQATSTKRPILKQDANGKYYLLFDGIAAALDTGSINFTGTDKVTVFAGLRKASDVATAILIEFSASATANNGAFLMVAPSGAATEAYTFGSKGTIRSDAITGLVYIAPITSILTGIGDISGDTSILRVNGVQAAINTADQGTGNYGNYPLYIGSRAGTSLPFNGHLYSLIVRGAASTDAQIVSAETYVNGKTGAY